MSLFALVCSTEFTPFRGLRKERMEKQIDDTRAREKSQRDSQREMQVLCPTRGTRAINFAVC